MHAVMYKPKLVIMIPITCSIIIAPFRPHANFFSMPFYFQAVQLHLANVVKLLEA
jgi:hypothetical protein